MPPCCGHKPPQASDSLKQPDMSDLNLPQKPGLIASQSLSNPLYRTHNEQAYVVPGSWILGSLPPTIFFSDRLKVLSKQFSNTIESIQGFEPQHTGLQRALQSLRVMSRNIDYIGPCARSDRFTRKASARSKISGAHSRKRHQTNRTAIWHGVATYKKSGACHTDVIIYHSPRRSRRCRTPVSFFPHISRPDYSLVQIVVDTSILGMLGAKAFGLSRAHTKSVQLRSGITVVFMLSPSPYATGVLKSTSSGARYVRYQSHIRALADDGLFTWTSKSLIPLLGPDVFHGYFGDQSRYSNPTRQAACQTIRYKPYILENLEINSDIPGTL
nr:hypothetical protein CFP56_63352 [Quercus suber]